jgi:indole-3-glycerol phosphate synthase
MNILDKIVARKKEEVAEAKALVSIQALEAQPAFGRPTHSLRQFLLDPQRTGIIAEFKRRSPSKGDLNRSASVAEVTAGYAAAGASALSILTDRDFFAGSPEDLIAGRLANEVPILRKDFMIDEYQIIEARSMGADVILLIAECLDKKEVAALAKMAKSLDLEVLLEVHSADQLDKWTPDIDVVGVNNRNLKTFEVSVQTSLDLFDQMPKEALRISESGISQAETIVQLKQAGFQGFLIGEHFMRDERPHQRFADFVGQIKAIESQVFNLQN